MIDPNLIALALGLGAAGTVAKDVGNAVGAAGNVPTGGLDMRRRLAMGQGPSIQPMYGPGGVTSMPHGQFAADMRLASEMGKPR